jgi:hypothetical protein
VCQFSKNKGIYPKKMMPSEEPPPCLSELVESRKVEEKGQVPPLVRRCRPDCLHFDTATARASPEPAAAERLRQDYMQGRFMNCRNRQSLE